MVGLDPARSLVNFRDHDQKWSDFMIANKVEALQRKTRWSVFVDHHADSLSTTAADTGSVAKQPDKCARPINWKAVS